MAEVAVENADLAALLTAWRHEQAGQNGGGRPVRFVIELRQPVSDEAIVHSVQQALSIQVSVFPLFPNASDLEQFRRLSVPHVTRPDRADLFEAATSLRDLLGAETVEPDLGTDYFECDCESPDPGAPESADWTFWCWANAEKDKPADRNWAIDKSLVKQAWEFATSEGRLAKGKDVLVFQPDTGVAPQHAELPPNLDADPRSANFVEVGERPIDPLRTGLNPGHGTGTASVVASPEPGAMTGSAPLATLVPIRCIESVSVLDQSPVAQAVNHAVEKGAHVITMSLGGIPSRALHAAVQKAVRNNIIVLAAAGNCVSEVVWPARYAEVIALGGINEAFKPWRGSCFGPAVAFSAPAEFVLRADAKHPSGELAASGGQGTSFATALTAGIAALWLAFHGRDALIAKLPEGRSLQWLFRSLVAATAQVPGDFDRENFGAGIIDALALLKADPAVAIASGGTEAAAGPGSDELKDLLVRTFGIGVEAVGPAVDDRQHAAELACAAFDRLRAAKTLRAHVESMPPPLLSPALRAKLGTGIDILRLN
ncbi:S8 family peptidase [Bradyrhizobium paxllaeri]|uniref:S8 family peptidase n=1 Tax=Bradyrhizobium paxllaeri TaxID=190148 RepID=UPI000810805F|nr:S8/S53 family peptidase [Bradyrhizobium paxllaeri]